jgi:hypothetical protein
MIRKEYTYKLQGDGRDSWTVSEYDENDELVSIYMVYENPFESTGTALRAVLSATPEEIAEIKRILGI